MIISGFGMCNGYYQKLKSGTFNLNKFYLRRYQKVVPFFALLIILNCVIDFKWQTIFEGCMEMTMLFGFLPNNSLSTIGVAWTLGAIFAFYVIFPFVVFLLDNKRRAVITLLVSLGITYMCQTYFMVSPFVVENFTMRHSFLFCLPYFICGGLIYLCRNEISEIVSKHKILCFTICAVLIVTYLLTPDQIGLIDIIVPKTILLYSACVCVALCEKTPLLSNRFTNFISGISMEMYLAHMVVFRIVDKLRVPELFGNTTSGFLITYMLVVILLVIGILLYRIVESKIKRKSFV